ncbi:YiiX family permuted papain-like enzyme [Pontibacter sp. G13]|uniref:YiiX family permuted papain-like enzyme n=1 Tax=Pontibacter sp. G13 TaxID=3074898 RepID=UPI00288BA5C3|nr:YiiX family permuted papain-like enzyme [Pontibacter sp. G13]WNJ17878.1 YiiX family permuted papain-like enzyme [Pontibacter sp. G13]
MKNHLMKRTRLMTVAVGIYVLCTFPSTAIPPDTLGMDQQILQVQIIEKEARIQEGDIIFQTSKSNQSKAIQLATGSRYSHLGIIFKNSGKYFVYEAVQPVKFTPLEDWINRGENGHYVIKRLLNSEQHLTDEALRNMRRIGMQFMGKPYDLYFEWSDERIYCSELVWKIYKQALDIEIGSLEALASFDLSHEVVRTKLHERYGDQIPMQEKVISPAAMFHSDQLVLVDEQ